MEDLSLILLFSAEPTLLDDWTLTKLFANFFLGSTKILYFFSNSSKFSDDEACDSIL
jgi:hypothetical protein